jgi:hypothetical protein
MDTINRAGGQNAMNTRSPGVIWALMAVFTTIAIWTAIALVLIFTAGEGSVVPMTFILAAAGFASTGVIWDSASKAARASGDQAEEAAKRKRDTRARRLLENLDEDEIVELHELLEARREDRLSQ